MTRIKRLFSLILLVLVMVCSFASCWSVPENEVQARLITSKITYIKEENKSEIFVFFDILNGKKRAIERFEADVTFTMKDGTVIQDTIHFDEKIEYAKSSPARYTFYVDGRVDKGEFTAFRFEMLDYWDSFGSAIIGFSISFLVIGFVFMFFSMAEMTGVLSVGAAAILLFDIAFLIFSPFIRAIIVILTSLLAFVPMVIQHIFGDY
jgi:hypothetical protein